MFPSGYVLIGSAPAGLLLVTIILLVMDKQRIALASLILGTLALLTVIGVFIIKSVTWNFHFHNQFEEIGFYGLIGIVVFQIIVIIALSFAVSKTHRCESCRGIYLTAKMITCTKCSKKLCKMCSDREAGLCIDCKIQTNTAQKVSAYERRQQKKQLMQKMRIMNIPLEEEPDIPEMDDSVWICEFCGCNNPRSSTFCADCGTPFQINRRPNRSFFG